MFKKLHFSLFMSRVPKPFICSVDVIAKKAISANLSCLNYLKQMPPTTLQLFFRIIIDSWFRSNTSFTIYSLGIFGSCRAKMFFKSSKCFRFYCTRSFFITLKMIWWLCSCCLAALSLATKPSPTF